MWTYYCYDDGKEVDLWSAWYKQRDEQTQAAHDQVWDALEQLQANDWRLPLARHLKDSLVEVRIRRDVQWRFLGYYGPRKHRNAFTLLLICYHKQQRYTPRDAIKIARKRLSRVKRDSSKVKSCARPNQDGTL